MTRVLVEAAAPMGTVAQTAPDTLSGGLRRAASTNTRTPLSEQPTFPDNAAARLLAERRTKGVSCHEPSVSSYVQDSGALTGAPCGGPKRA